MPTQSCEHGTQPAPFSGHTKKLASRGPSRGPGRAGGQEPFQEPARAGQRQDGTSPRAHSPYFSLKPPQNRSASTQKEAKSTECGNETATKWQRSGNGNTLAIPQIRLRTSPRSIQLVSFLLTLTGRSSCATRHANMLRGQHFGPEPGMWFLLKVDENLSGGIPGE